MSDQQTVTCPACFGRGRRQTFSIACGPTGCRDDVREQRCWHCEGTGSVPVEQEERRKLGTEVRVVRVRLGLSQADFAAIVKTDRFAYSKAENLGVGEPALFERMRDWLESQPMEAVRVD